MQSRNPFIAVLMALGLLAPVAFIAYTNTTNAEPLQQEADHVDIGEYEVVLDWPRPLPDDDLSHDGWTWGSGSGVHVENSGQGLGLAAGRNLAAARSGALDMWLLTRPSPDEYRQVALCRQGI